MSWEWGLGRIGMAVLAGAILAHTGSLIQLTSRNEMASPSTLGIDGIAVAVVLFLYGIQSFFQLSFSLEQLGMMAVVLIGVVLFVMPTRWTPYQGVRGQDFRFVLLLGLSLNLMIGALFAVMQFMAMAFDHEFPDQLWFGRIDTPTAWQWMGGIAVVMAILMMGYRYRHQWKALLLGSGWCHGLGVPVQKMTKDALWIALMGNLWVITQFGVFSFLGLLFPILLRQLKRYQGSPWRELTEGAFVCGVGFALLDHVCFNFTFHGAEIPVGLPASLFGSLSLVILLWRRFLSQNSLAKAP